MYEILQSHFSILVRSDSLTKTLRLKIKVMSVVIKRKMNDSHYGSKRQTLHKEMNLEIVFCEHTVVRLRYLYDALLNFP